MKKIILSIVFVFASFAMVNANSDLVNKLELSSDCDNFALHAGESADIAGYSMEEIFVFMNVAYALCEGYTYAEIEAAGNL